MSDGTFTMSMNPGPPCHANFEMCFLEQAADPSIYIYIYMRERKRERERARAIEKARERERERKSDIGLCNYGNYR